ncbi:hypothetical protein L9F63_010042 [Diploptera punctata]|uniref:Cilia- and flagella-associated protein 126 n=1 Tax=Diploptera punctata TaxID=6984 RepID=A0AAD8ERW0_DIPPU|nr:hypothetical protein L9F63_010042 [Diploptera punctata]
MSLYFSAHQFDHAYTARRLRNWETPKWFPSRPRAPCKSPTSIIVNDRGHLLPGMARFPGDSSWGCYVGTWDLPRRITRKTAAEITNPPRERVAVWSRTRPCHEKTHFRTAKRKEEKLTFDHVKGVDHPTDMWHDCSI